MAGVEHVFPEIADMLSAMTATVSGPSKRSAGSVIRRLRIPTKAATYSNLIAATIPI